jgi:hypothetical protein
MLRTVILVLSLLLANSTWASELKVTSGRAELVFVGISAKDTATIVNDAISGLFRTIPMSMRPLPATLAVRPGRPTEQSVQVQGIDVPFITCPDSFADMFDKGTPTRTQMSQSGDMFRACVYPFEKGVKVYLMALTYQNHLMLSGLFSGITTTIRGSDDEWMARRINDIIGKMRVKAPDLLVERVEIPGQPVSQPDREAVHNLIPDEPQNRHIATTPGTTGTSGTNSAAQDQAAVLGARKSLHEMGLVYYSQEQFIAAIRRKDDLAVKLFLDAGGVDPAAKDAGGKTALDIAREGNAENIVRLLQGGEGVKSQAQTPPATLRGDAAPPRRGQLSLEQQEQLRQQILTQIRQQAQAQ